MSDGIQDTFSLGDRVRFTWRDGNRDDDILDPNVPFILGIVVSSPRDWGDRAWDPNTRTPVLFDGDDYVSSSLTECLTHE